MTGGFNVGLVGLVVITSDVGTSEGGVYGGSNGIALVTRVFVGSVVPGPVVLTRVVVGGVVVTCVVVRVVVIDGGTVSGGGDDVSVGAIRGIADAGVVVVGVLVAAVVLEVVVDVLGATAGTVRMAAGVRTTMAPPIANSTSAAPRPARAVLPRGFVVDVFVDTGASSRSPMSKSLFGHQD